MERSKVVPVVVDLWAPWCEPCKQLTPVLKEIIKDADGSVLLAQTDIDKNKPITPTALHLHSEGCERIYISLCVNTINT